MVAFARVRTFWTLGALLLLANVATAQVTYTGNTNTGSFYSAGSWLPISGPPGSGDSTLFNSVGTHSVQFGSTVSNVASTLSNGAVEWGSTAGGPSLTT